MSSVRRASCAAMVAVRSTINILGSGFMHETCVGAAFIPSNCSSDFSIWSCYLSWPALLARELGFIRRTAARGTPTATLPRTNRSCGEVIAIEGKAGNVAGSRARRGWADT